MDTTRYKIWQWDRKPTGAGRGVQHNCVVGVWTKAKRSNVNEYEIANELLCLRLGLALRLPIPLGALIDYQDKTYYASLHVAASGEELPEATDEDLDAIARNERLACGIVMFDSWVLNEDRHRSNIAYLDETDEVFLIDHGSAFFDKEGRRYLEANRNAICIGDHCLATRLKTLWDFYDWHRRMLDIPVGYIRDTVELASEVGLPKCEIDFSVDYLVDRRGRLPFIFAQNKNRVFPNLDHGLFDPLAELPIEYCI